MTKIRLLRRGRKGQPFFSIIAIDSRRSPKSKKIIRDLGYYNPMEKDFSKKVMIKDLSEIEKLVSNGAHLSTTMKSIVKKVAISQVKS